jgi:hypothetical protein
MLRLPVLSAVFGLLLIVPAAAQSPNVQQLLQGLMTGNQGQDQALRDAFERGYQRGRQDEARMHRSDRREGYREDRGFRDERGPRDERGRDQPYDRQGGNPYQR